MLPDLHPTEALATRRLIPRAVRDMEATEYAVYRKALHARAAVEFDRIDSAAARDAASYALDAEIAFLDYGRQRAGDDATKALMVAEKLAALSRANNLRFQTRFGR